MYGGDVLILWLLQVHDRCVAAPAGRLSGRCWRVRAVSACEGTWHVHSVSGSVHSAGADISDLHEAPEVP